MKKILVGVVLSFLVGASVWAGDPGGPLRLAVSTNAVMLFPDRSIVTAPAFATATAYQSGDYVLSAGRVYWCAVGGTSSGLPLPRDYFNAVTNGTCTFVAMPPGRRTSINVINQGPASVFLAVGWPAKADAGIMVTPNGWWGENPAPQGAVWAISTNSGNYVSLQDY
jgi:hypothetical protein